MNIFYDLSALNARITSCEKKHGTICVLAAVPTKEKLSK
jgi:hypothetical protein